MYAYNKSAEFDYLETLPASERPEELWYDEDFFEALVDAVNQNFVLEVEASRDRKE
jgi:hypothetical protein